LSKTSENPGGAVVLPRHRLVVALVALAILTGAQQATPVPSTIDAGMVGPPFSNARAELFLPAGSGPYPAMVVLHGCSGVVPHDRVWAQQLVAWGYIAVLVDSFRPRGIDNVCNHGMIVPPLVQAQDAFAAAEYLRGLPNVQAERIGVIGFSHGGWAVLKAVLEYAVHADHAHPFAAAVAFYPGCDSPDSALVTDTLILIGDADDWTPVGRCARWRDTVASAGHEVRMTVYPGAFHAFDALTPPRAYAGHTIGRNPEAAAAAVAETRSFLAKRLSP
jgi:dienelactone hydrolase